MEEKFKISPTEIGMILSIGFIPYIILCPFISLIAEKFKDKKMFMLFGGIFLCGSALFFLGPDTDITYIPLYLWIICISEGIISFG